MINKVLIFLFAIFLLATLTSCESKYDEINVAFYDLYENIIEEEYDQVIEKFDEESLAFFNDVTNLENLEYDKMLELGKKWYLKYTLISFLASHGEKMKAMNDPEYFFNFLTNYHISFYAPDVFETMDAQTRIGEETLVAITRMDYNAKKISWIKLQEQIDDSYKYNIIYTLRLYERKQKFSNENYLRDKSGESIAQNLRDYYDKNKVYADLYRVENYVNKATQRKRKYHYKRVTEMTTVELIKSFFE